MKARIPSWSAFLIIGIGFTAFGQPQVMQLDDGTKLTFLDVTTGTRQMAPGYENLGTANWLYTPDRPSVVWILAEHEPGKWPNYELLISDKAKTGCVNLEKSTGSHVRDGVDIQGFLMRAFPRWDKEMLARVKPYGAAVSKGEFVITNPAPAALENWTPEPLPATRSDGDLEVTLTKLVAGAPVPYRQGEHPLTNEPANLCVHLNFDFRQNGRPTTNWGPWPVVTSDATGNRVRGAVVAGVEHPCDRVISTVPIQYVPRLVPDLPDGFAARIRAIENIPVVCVVLKLRRALTPNFWLNICDDTIDIPGIVEYSNLNPQAGPAIVYVPFYMPKTHPKFARDNAAFVDETIGYLSRLNPEFAADWILATHCHRYEFAQTICPPGFFDLLPPMQTPIQGLFMADTSYYYPEDRSISESVTVGKTLARLCMA